MAKKDLGYMPHSLEAEQALLSCLLMDTRIQVEVSAFLREEDFFAESHKNIFHAMLDIIKNNLPVDMLIKKGINVSWLISKEFIPPVSIKILVL